MSVKTVANYVWPDSGVPLTFFTKETGGHLTLSSFKGDIITANIDFELEAFLKNGGANYLNFNLPKLYHGIVQRQFLESIKEKAGVYFGGLSPDIFISIAIACVAKRVVITDYPLTLPGVCGVSGSIVEGLLKKNSKKLEDAPHLRHRGDYTWCELIPRIYTVETIWADSSIAALRAMGRDDLVQQLNLPKLAAYCIIANKGVVWKVIHGLFKGLQIMHKAKVIGVILFMNNLLILRVNSILILALRIWNRILITIGKRTVLRIDGLMNIFEASNALSSYLKENGHSFEKCIKRRAEMIK